MEESGFEKMPVAYPVLLVDLINQANVWLQNTNVDYML